MIKAFKKTYFILLPLAVTVLSLALHMTRFVINDDIGLLLIAESFKTNAHSEQLLFMSVLYGYLLKLLYNLIPSINWFLLLELGVLNIGFISLFRLSQKLEYKIVSASALIISQFFILANLTFTSISFVVLTAGMLWYFVNVDKLNKESIKHILFTLVLFLLGLGMRRDDTFLFISLLFAAVFGITFLKKKKSFLAILLVFAICFGSNYFFGFTQSFYNSHLEDNQYFYELNKVRSDANDGGVFNYKAHKDEFLEVGLSKNDYKLASHWLYADKNVFTIEAFKKIGEVRSFDEKYNTDIKALYKEITSQNTLLLFVAILLLMLIIEFILLKSGRLEAAAAMLMTLFGAFYIYFRRRGVERVACPIVLCGILTLLYIFLANLGGVKERFKRLDKKPVNAIFAILCAVCIALSFGYNVKTAKTIDKKAERVQGIVDYVNENEDKLFISDAYAIDKYRVYHANKNIIKPYSNSDFRIYSILGNWNIYTAYYYDNLDRLGIGEYSEALMKVLLKDDVYFITKKFKPEDIVKYFDENYDLKVGYKTVTEFDNLNTKIYDFYVNE